MKKTRFRVSKNDTIKATATGKNGFLCSLYDSQFTTISEIVSSLIRKVPHYSGKKIEISIYNEDKQTSKCLTVNVNR